MPYFIDSSNQRIVLLAPGTPPMPGLQVIDGDTATACALSDGQSVTPAQIAALLDGSVAAFRSTLDPQSAAQFEAARAAARPADPYRLPPGALPPEGFWQHRVEVVGRVADAGLLRTTSATQKSLANLLTEAGRDGWELVSMADRDNTWGGGEAVLVVMKRYVVTTDSLSAHLVARRQIEARLQVS